jgi:hypothetical protein
MSHVWFHLFDAIGVKVLERLTRRVAWRLY